MVLRAEGDTGAAGAVGAAGATGATGATGPAGPAGLSVPGVVVTHVTGGDSSHCGGDWANDDYKRTLQFIPQDDGTIQVVRSYDGTFTTIAGASSPIRPRAPALCRTGGVTGTITGFDVVVVTGGVFTPNATCPDPCTTAAMLATFFPARGGPAATSPVTTGGSISTTRALTACWVNRSACARRGHRQHHRLGTDGGGLDPPPPVPFRRSLRFVDGAERASGLPSASALSCSDRGGALRDYDTADDDAVVERRFALGLLCSPRWRAFWAPSCHFLHGEAGGASSAIGRETLDRR